MGLLNRLSSELRGVGKAARGAIDEGKVRIELFRVRQLADKAAQAVGYAVHRARAEGQEPDSAELQRLESKLTEHETEAHRLEEALRGLTTSPETPPTP